MQSVIPLSTHRSHGRVSLHLRPDFLQCWHAAPRAGQGQIGPVSPPPAQRRGDEWTASPMATTTRLPFFLPPLSVVRSLTGEIGVPGLSHDMAEPFLSGFSERGGAWEPARRRPQPGQWRERRGGWWLAAR